MIGELLDLHCRSADEDYFGTQVVIEVHMRGSQDGMIIVVLELDEFFTELTDVVVVDQRDGSQRFLLSVLPSRAPRGDPGSYPARIQSGWCSPAALSLRAAPGAAGVRRVAVRSAIPAYSRSQLTCAIANVRSL